MLISSSQLTMALTESQKRAVELALRSKVLVITGGPGVRKATLVNSILKILMVKQVTVALLRCLQGGQPLACAAATQRRTARHAGIGILWPGRRGPPIPAGELVSRQRSASAPGMSSTPIGPVWLPAVIVAKPISLSPVPVNSPALLPGVDGQSIAFPAISDLGSPGHLRDPSLAISIDSTPSKG